jgi:7-carboxy-7-deazaguanine synthase
MSELKLNEIFYSIQGEGSRAGLPCVFVRLHGCGLRCAWCDTPYALEHGTGGTLVTIQHILDHVAKYRCSFIELTGGEPLEQEQSFTLLRRLCDEKYTTAVETGGHVSIRNVDARVIIIMDLKCPSSGMTKKNLYENLEYLKPTDELKFVIADRTDFEWARDQVKARNLRRFCDEIVFSPAFGLLEPLQLTEWILDEHLSVRLQLQLHKYIWHPETRGV